ncbi:MAG TPA: glycosyltransferase [Planctomycetota bacterium]|nr:glycosyltransferase [Planctomycetota bacterium]
MRIALVVHGFPPHECTGVETHVAALAKCLGQHGVEVEVFAPRKDPRAPEFAQRREAREGYHVTWIVANQTPRSAAEHLDRPGMAAAFGEFLERTRPALVHFHHVVKLGVGLIEETARRGIPSIYTAHDYYPICHRTVLARPDLTRCSTLRDSAACARCDTAVSFLNRQNRWSDYHAGVLPESLPAAERTELARLLESSRPASEYSESIESRTALDLRRKEAFDLLDLVLAPTQFLRAQLIAGGFDADRVVVDPYGIESAALEALAPPRDSSTRLLTFGYLGGALKHKGLHVLLEAFAPLRDQARLVIHADSSDREYVHALQLRAQELGVDWRGAFAAAELASVLEGIDVLIVPSIWWENAPFVIREAFAASRPVIASDTPALRESVRDGVDGVLVPPGDVAALHAAMQRFIDEPELFKLLMGNVQPQRSLDVQCSELLERYGKLAPGKPKLPEGIPASARAFTERVLHTEQLTLRELAQTASEGLSALAASLGVDPTLAQPVDVRELAIEHLQDARREIAWRVSRESRSIADLERERELRMALASELKRAQADGDQARNALHRAQIELAGRGRELEASEQVIDAARSALAEEQRAHEAARSALEAARHALEEASGYCNQFAAQLEELRVAREELARELSVSRAGALRAEQRAAELASAHTDLARGFSELLAHAQWLEQESASLARRFGHDAVALHSGTDFIAARAAVDRFERELAWRRGEMTAAQREGGSLLRAIVRRSGLGRRLRGWEEDK